MEKRVDLANASYATVFGFPRAEGGRLSFATGIVSHTSGFGFSFTLSSPFPSSMEPRIGRQSQFFESEENSMENQ
jgi:hypothetical protein